MVHERRHFVRVAFDAPAQLTTGHGTVVAQVIDLSLKGALLSLPAGLALQPGMPCQLVVPLESSVEHVSMAAEIAHLDGHWAGLLCTGIDLDSVTHLRRIIELQLGDPALLERDLTELIAGHQAGAGAVSTGG